MTVRAKFKVCSITESASTVQNPETKAWEPGKLKTIELSPVMANGDPDHENSKFWAASPSGGVRLGYVNMKAAEQFEVGKEYYVDFTPAE